MDPQNKQEALDDVKRVGIAAAQELATAALEAAQKPGFKTTEFFATLLTILITGAGTLVQELSKVPGPWQLAAVGIAAGLGVTAMYGWHRTTLKAAALAAAGAALKAATSGPTVMTVHHTTEAAPVPAPAPAPTA